MKDHRNKKCVVCKDMFIIWDTHYDNTEEYTKIYCLDCWEKKGKPKFKKGD